LYANLRIMVHQKAGHGPETQVVKTVATEDKGIADLANAIEEFFARAGVHNEHKLQLATEKVWQLLQAERMKGFDKTAVKQTLAEALDKPGFNLYTFTKQVLAKHGS